MRNNITNRTQIVVLLSLFLALFSACADRSPAESRPGDPSDGAPASSRLAGLLGAGSDARFPRVTEPRRFQFPRDHGSHDEYRNEWWYVTGNVDGPAGERFGYELTLFRFALRPPTPDDDAREDQGFRSRQVYVGHVALTDVERGDFHVAERYSRGSLGLAGATADPFRVWLGNWEIAAQPGADGAAERFQLQASDETVALELTLIAEKPPVLQGDAGLSRKSSEPGNASYYYSMTRLATTGSLSIKGRRFEVTGDSWLDREWGSSALSSEQVGWDWFALQFADGSELMFYNIRSRDGSTDEMSAGKFIARDGSATSLSKDEVDIEILRQWQSPAGGSYPAQWRLAIESLGIDVELTPVMDDQELATAVRYWEGAIDLRGTRQGELLSGRGYVELTGYAP